MSRRFVCLLFLGAAVAAAGAEEPEDALPELPAKSTFRKRTSASGVDGVIRLSNGTAIGGKVSMTPDKRLELYDVKRMKWIRTTIKQVRLLEFSVEFEKVQEHWRWKASGRDEKVYTGKRYVDRRYQADLTVKRGGKKYSGHVLGTVVYVTDAKGTKHRYLLRKDQRGDLDQKPEQIVYVAQIDLRPGALEKHREEEKKKAEKKKPEKPDEHAGGKPSDDQ